MPNHVTNLVRLKGDTDHIKNLREAIKNDELGLGSIDFEKVIPMPADIFRGNLGAAERAKYGERNWYDWSIKNWGTKWNAYGNVGDLGVKAPDMICFTTAWAAPHKVISKLAQMNPDLEVEHYWADEDLGFNCGKRVYVGGEVKSLYMPNFGRDSQEFAAAVLGEELADRGLVLNEEGTEYVYRNEEEEFDVSMS